MNGVHCQTSAAMIDSFGQLGDPIGLWRGVVAEQTPHPGDDAVDQPVGRVQQRVLPRSARRRSARPGTA